MAPYLPARSTLYLHGGLAACELEGLVTARARARAKAPVAAAAALLLTLASLGCSGSEGDTGAARCVPGKQESCKCLDGREAVQVCDDEGRFLPCGPCPADLADADDVTTSPDSAPSERDEGSTPGTDPGEAPATDVARTETCQPCGYGSLKGRVCAPSQQIYVANARVTIDTYDCEGKELHLETVTKGNGSYSFERVPCGDQKVKVEAGSFNTTFNVPIRTGQGSDITGVGTKLCFAANAANIAVFWGQWDEMHHLLGQLEVDYTFYNYKPDWEADTRPEEIEAVKLLLDPDRLAAYDILFFNCGSEYVDWVDQVPAIGENLKDFVHDGGSIYASDRAWALVEAAFPDAVDFWGNKELTQEVAHACGRSLCGFDTQRYPDGVPVEATILDTTLISYLDGTSTFTAYYGSGPLVSVEGVPEGTTTHVQGLVKLDEKQGLFKEYREEIQPVVVSFRPEPGAGSVVFTTFHNDDQADELMRRILYFLVFLL